MFQRDHVKIKSSRARVGLNRFFQSSQSSSQVGCITSGFITSLNICISAVPSSAAWVGTTLILALHMLLKMALSNPTLYSHTLHTDLGYTVFFFKFFCSAEHNFRVRNCFSADTCGSAFPFVLRWVVMKSVLLISFSGASSPKSKEVNYGTVGEKKMQIPRLMVFPSRKNGHADVKKKNVEIMFRDQSRRELQHCNSPLSASF